MNNQHKYTLLRLCEFVRGVFFSVIFIFIPKKKNRIIFNSSYNIHFNFNSKPLFLYFLTQVEQGANFEVKYVVNCPKKLEKLTSTYGDHFINNKNLLSMFYILRAKSWVVSTNDLPVFGIFNRIGRKVHHLTHGTVFKNAGLLEKKVGILKKIYYFLLRTNINYFYTSSEFLIPKIAQMYNVPQSRIKIMQHPRNEQLVQNQSQLRGEQGKKKILYAPTWRKNSESTFFPFTDFDKKSLSTFLVENNVEMYLRLHPYFEKDLPIWLLEIDGIKLLSSKSCPEINEKMHEFDMLISDYSSIFIDFLLLNKPMLFIANDYEDYNSKIGFVFDYDSHTPGPKVANFSELVESIRIGVRDRSWYSKERSFALEQFHSLPAENALSRAYNEIIEPI